VSVEREIEDLARRVAREEIERAAEIVAEQMEREASPWMTRAQAARYLRVPESRLEKDAAKKGRRAIPVHHDFALCRDHRDELDRWLLERT
jgi:hypothetical protein